MSSTISRRKLADTEDFLKALSDMIREEKMGQSGATAQGATINYIIIPTGTITLSQVAMTGSTTNAGQYVIGSAIIGYADIG